MSSNNSNKFNKNNLDNYLNELSKEYKRLGGRKTPVEIILIGGAAIIENYGFRDMTTDIDAILPSMSNMKEAINRVGDKFGLSNGWLNADFMKTSSYTDKLFQYSVYYKTFNQVLNVRIISGEYLIAMKLKSSRRYKNDLSDIIGILSEHRKNEEPISFNMIDTAVCNLYGGWEVFSDDSLKYIQNLLDIENYDEAYQSIRDNEISAKGILLDLQNQDVLNEENINVILNKKIGSRSDIIHLLSNKKK